LQQGISYRKKLQFKYTQYASASTLFFMYITIYKQNVKKIKIISRISSPN